MHNFRVAFQRGCLKIFAPPSKNQGVEMLKLLLNLSYELIVKNFNKIYFKKII
jgi:hypothetical protein